MFLGDWIAFAVCAALGGAQLLRRSLLVRFGRHAFYVAAILVFGMVAYQSFLQYRVWAADPLGKFLLPPTTDISYFLGYVGTRFWAPWFIALAGAILAGYAMRVVNRHFGERFLEPEEPVLSALGIFLTGYPGFLFYIVAMLLTGTAFSALNAMRGKGRAPLFYLWLPIALFVIIIRHWLIPPELLGQFNL